MPSGPARSEPRTSSASRSTWRRWPGSCGRRSLPNARYSPSGMAQPTVLVVDDEKLIRWSLKERLQAAGYHVSEAADGGEALRRIEEGADLVLLDLKLPDADGVTIL